MEARLRQLEGKLLAGESGRPRGKPDTPKYDASRQGGAGAALLSAPKAYNPDADVTASAGKEPKKKKKVRGPFLDCQKLPTSADFILVSADACMQSMPYGLFWLFAEAEGG